MEKRPIATSVRPCVDTCVGAYTTEFCSTSHKCLFFFFFPSGCFLLFNKSQTTPLRIQLCLNGGSSLGRQMATSRPSENPITDPILICNCPTSLLMISIVGLHFVSFHFLHLQYLQNKVPGQFPRICGMHQCAARHPNKQA